MGNHTKRGAGRFDTSKRSPGGRKEEEQEEERVLIETKLSLNITSNTLAARQQHASNTLATH